MNLSTRGAHDGGERCIVEREHLFVHLSMIVPTGSNREYDDEYEADNDNIRARIRLPPMTMTNVTGEGGESPRPGPPPTRMQQRLPPSYIDIPPTSPRARVVSVTS